MGPAPFERDPIPSRQGWKLREGKKASFQKHAELAERAWGHALRIDPGQAQTYALMATHAIFTRAEPAKEGVERTLAVRLECT